MEQIIPVKIELKKQSGVLLLQYEQEEPYELSFEFLRVHSPSAEVRGHGKPVLQTGKRTTQLIGIEPTGNYALKFIFDDGHDSGLYTWTYLRELCQNRDAMWQTYLNQVEQSGEQR